MNDILGCSINCLNCDIIYDNCTNCSNNKILLNNLTKGTC